MECQVVDSSGHAKPYQQPTNEIWKFDWNASKNGASKKERKEERKKEREGEGRRGIADFLSLPPPLPFFSLVLPLPSLSLCRFKPSQSSMRANRPILPAG